MSALQATLARRHFAARYANVGRAMLGQLADMYGITVDVATMWADEIDIQNQETPCRGEYTADRPALCDLSPGQVSRADPPRGLPSNNFHLGGELRWIGPCCAAWKAEAR
jgi:hypothetical protein